MNTEQLTSIIKLYMYQNMYSENSSTSSSVLFETMLMKAVESINDGNSSLIGTYLNSNIDTAGVSGKTKSTSSEEAFKNGDNSIESAIKYVSDKYDVERELISAVIKQESSFNPNAVSSAGAQGLMQLMPSTAKSLGVENPFNVMDNIDGGTRYLKRLLEAFDGNKELALAAYNGGIGRMNRLGVDTAVEISRMPKETENFVARVMRNYRNYKSI